MSRYESGAAPEDAFQAGSVNYRWLTGACVTFFLALACRLLEWPMWQNPEFSYDNEMLLATHDAYHWVAGAVGFGGAVGHPMAAMLKAAAAILHQAPANVAFWAPPVFASLVAVMTFLWARLLGAGHAAIAAGLIAAISPGFLGRTLLGYYDTDLVTLLFPLAITFVPALWCVRFLRSPRDAWLYFCQKSENQAGEAGDAAAPFWLSAMALSGLLACWSQHWHSVFPYLVRYNVIFLLFMALVLGPQLKNRFLAPLAYSFASASAPWGLFFVPLVIVANRHPLGRRLLGSLWMMPICLVVLVLLLAQGEILQTLLNQVNAYLKSSGDSHVSGQTSIVFPSVAQSIIEVQDLAVAAMFPYFHPWAEAAILGFIGFVVLIFFRPAAMFLLPLAALGILSARLGGRMVMFGAPVVALGVAVPLRWLLTRLLRRWLSLAASTWVVCALLLASLVFPFLNMIPSLSQGPILNRRHAAALASVRAITPPDAMLWLWWDWGYAAQYFAHRHTIADGARHGGPSLYLPAAVFATDNVRFARQVICYASMRGNEPGNFFKDLNQDQAQALVTRLQSPQTPLVPGVGRQYVIVSFEMLKLGFWISNFGNWNFITRRGEGGALSIVPQGVAYRLNGGEVRLEGHKGIIFPISINVFAESGLSRRNYVQEWFAAHPRASAAEQKAFLASRRNVNFLFNRVTDEKLAVNEAIYNSLMVQLLLCEAHDPRFAPYFRLVYDNVFTRVYEVLP